MSDADEARRIATGPAPSQLIAGPTPDAAVEAPFDPLAVMGWTA